MQQITITITKADLLSAIDKALSDYKIAALTAQHDQILYDYIEKSADIAWSCQQTILSPKKFLFPQEETFLEYTDKGKVTPKVEVYPQILFGIRPCDLHAIQLLDEAFADVHGDPNYLAKREKTLIVGIDCKEICSEKAFCYKVKSHEAPDNYDLMLHPIGNEMIIVVATEKGKAFAKKYLKAKKGGEEKLAAYQKERKQNFAKEKPFKNLNKLPEIFEKNHHHPIWEEEGNRCLSCGSCIMSCPTCYCFDVVDEWALNLKKGERIRRWDACVLNPFAKVASGENFRPKSTERLHHRINRKFNYLMKKHKRPVCVGCGRCVRACLAEISPKKIVEKITGETE